MDGKIYGNSIYGITKTSQNVLSPVPFLVINEKTGHFVHSVPLVTDSVSFYLVILSDLVPTTSSSSTSSKSNFHLYVVRGGIV